MSRSTKAELAETLKLMIRALTHDGQAQSLSHPERASALADDPRSAALDRACVTQTVAVRHSEGVWKPNSPLPVDFLQVK